MHRGDPWGGEREHRGGAGGGPGEGPPHLAAVLVHLEMLLRIGGAIRFVHFINCLCQLPTLTAPGSAPPFQRSRRRTAVQPCPRVLAAGRLQPAYLHKTPPCPPPPPL